MWISRKASFGFLIFINWKWVAVLKRFSNVSIFPLKIMGRKESKGIYHLILIIKILKSMTFRKVNELATWSWTPMTQSLDIWTVTLSYLTTCPEHAVSNKFYSRFVKKPLIKHTQWIDCSIIKENRDKSRKTSLPVHYSTIYPPQTCKLLYDYKNIFPRKTIVPCLFLINNHYSK